LEGPAAAYFAGALLAPALALCTHTLGKDLVMLVLARRLHERIIIPCIRTAVEVTAVKPGFVRLGVEAPPEVTVLREEVYCRLGSAAGADGLPAGAAAEARLAQANQVWRHRLHNLTLGLALLRQQLTPGAPAEALATLRLLENEAQEMCQELQALCQRKAAPEVAAACPAVVVAPAVRD
jgi:carbon storage regulator CsrA